MVSKLRTHNKFSFSVRMKRSATVSILLACIATRLEREGPCEDWTAQIIYDDRLTNPRKPPEKRRKLRLQNGDEEEYRRGLDGNAAGGGAVTQAWKIAHRLVGCVLRQPVNVSKLTY